MQLYHYDEQQLQWLDPNKGIPEGWEPVPMGSLSNDGNPFVGKLRSSWESEIEFD
jgi:hypothetical protein